MNKEDQHNPKRQDVHFDTLTYVYLNFNNTEGPPGKIVTLFSRRREFYRIEFQMKDYNNMDRVGSN